MIALAALQIAVRAALLNASPLWAERVYADGAPAEVLRPYVIVLVASGGEDNVRRVQDASFVLGIK